MTCSNSENSSRNKERFSFCLLVVRKGEERSDLLGMYCLSHCALMEDHGPYGNGFSWCCMKLIAENCDECNS